MSKWCCSVCGYCVESEVKPSECPICGAGDDQFTEQRAEGEIKTTLGEKDISDLKAALRKITYGLYIISSKKGEKLNGQAANTVFQITSDPMTIAIGINKDNFTRECIEETGYFTINILGTDGHKLVRRFGYRSGREFDKFNNINYKITTNGVPYLEDAVSWMECKVKEGFTMDCGTHVLILADVIGGKVLHEEKEIMTYAYYHATK